MEIKLLNRGYKNDEEFYKDFITDKLQDLDKDYISKESRVFLKTMPDFPIYLGRLDYDKKSEIFKENIIVINNYFLDLHKEYVLDEVFWHSYFCLYKREYLLKMYPEIRNSFLHFKNIVVKKFDWQNYIYKCVLAAQYVKYYSEESEHVRYYNLIVDNLDIFNYIIKYEIFRNGNFLINLLDIIDETNTSKILKARILDRPDLGDDERYGRRVIYEFNKSYPILLAPMLTKEELKIYFFQYLNLYYKGTEKIDIDEEWSEGEE